MSDDKPPRRAYYCTPLLEDTLTRSGSDWEDWRRSIVVDFLANKYNHPMFLKEGSFVLSRWGRVTETPHDLVNEFVASHLDDVLMDYRPGSKEEGHRCDPPFLRWAVGCFRKRAINILHKWNRQQRMEPLDDGVAEPVDEMFASELETALHEEQLITACIRFAPEKHRELLSLLLHGLEPHEIAERVGLPRGCVRVRLARIRHQLERHREAILRVLEGVRTGVNQ